MKYLFWTLLFSLVIFRFITTRPVYHNSDKLRITSKVLQEPISYSFYQTFSLEGLKISLPLFPEIHYGDKVIVEGLVENGELKNPDLKTIKESEGFLYKFKSRMISVYQKSLPEPHASLVAGITIGARSSLPQNFWNSLKKTGTAHVVVASGMNVTFVAGFLMAFLLLFFPRRVAIPVALTGVWFYAFISGFQAPIVRAGVMGSLVFLGQELGRLASAWRILVISAILMLIVSPDWLIDLGFILSFVSTTSLMLFQKKINGFLNRFKMLPKVIKEDFSTSLAAQIGVTPILFVTFGNFNILSPIINVLVLWTVAPIMIIGSIGGIVGLIWPDLGKVVLYLVYPLTWWFIKVISL